MTSQKLDELLAKAISDVKSAGVTPSSKIRPNVSIYKRTSCFGSCKYNGKDYEIFISEYHIPHGEDAVYRTLVHEVLHTVKGSVGHGSVWQMNAKKVGDKLGFKISRTETSKEFRLPKVCNHQVSCPVCGMKFRRARESNLTLNPHEYSCPECHKHGRRVPLRRDF